jgi:hypothetical protein
MQPVPPKDIEKSIDSLQRIHAVISALALGEAVRRLISNPGTAEASFNAEALPQFIALVCTIVPFYHGMHRHLEATYLFATDVRRPKSVLLIDFVVFVVEASTFFAMAALFKTPAFYWVLTAFLTFDAIWAGATALINSVSMFRWCLLNFLAAAAMLLVLSLNVFKSGMDVWLLTLIVGVRTILDYSTHWRFYFPFGDNAQKQGHPQNNDIAVEAYYLWESEGRPPGHNDEYWSRAEERLRQRCEPNTCRPGSTSSRSVP